MSDLVERLRKKVERFITMEATHTKTLEWEAADRIAQLEAALKMFACDFTITGRCAVPDNCPNFQARRIVEERA